MSVPASQTAVVLLLCGAIVAGPIALGATGPWVRLAVEAAMALAAVLWAASSRPRPAIALLPILIAAAIAIQLVPLPDGLASTIAPVSAAAWKIAHAGLGRTWHCITVDPAATAAGIRRLLLAAATLAVVADLARHPAHRKFLGAALSAVCLVIWGLGLLFPFDKSLVLLGFIDCKGPIEAEFWRTPLVPPIATNGSGVINWVTVAGQRYAMPSWIGADGFGPYIYGNHFAGAICLTLPVALGGWLAFSRSRLPDVARHAVVAIAFAAGLWTVGFMATSRAGGAALLLAALVFGSLTIRSGWLRFGFRAATAAYGICLLALVIAMYGPFGGFEGLLPADLRPRVGALLNDGRVVAGRVATRMFFASPLLGSGLGTYGELFDRFLRSDLLLGYAHNDYAQWLAETGLVGGLLAAPFLVLLAARYRSWIRAPGGEADPLGAGLWAAVTGIGVHTAFDWNLHLPANALLACVVFGMAAASGVSPSTRTARPNAKPQPQGERWPGLVLAAACLLALVFLGRDAVSNVVQRQLREAIVASRLAATDPKRTSASPALEAAIAAGERMAVWDPWNGSLAILVGQAYLHASAEQQPIDEASADAAAADRWFLAARRCCAACRGLPEPLAAPTSPVGK